MPELKRVAFVSFAALTILAFGCASTSKSESASAPRSEDPAPHYQHLKLDEGVWDATVTIVMDPTAPPQVSHGTQTNTLVCEGKWLQQDFKSDTFEGHGLIGWDAQKGKYVSVWIDTESPSLLTGEGTCSADGKTRTMMVHASDGQGKMMTMREVYAAQGPDNRTYTIFAPGPDGKEVTVVAVAYTRKKSR
jgi:hypothetical protein